MQDTVILTRSVPKGRKAVLGPRHLYPVEEWRIYQPEGRQEIKKTIWWKPKDKSISRRVRASSTEKSKKAKTKV